MKTTVSRDGRIRASMKVEFRLDLSCFAHALSYMILNDPILPAYPDDLDYEMAVSRHSRSKKAVVKQMRSLLANRGYTAFEEEHQLPDSITAECLKVCQRLFPEFGS